MAQLLQNAACGTALILACVLLRRLLKGRLVPGARLALWAVCLARLLAPAFPASALSLWGLLPRGEVSALPAPVPGGAVGGAPDLAAPPSAPTKAGIPWEIALLAVWAGVGLLLAARYVWSWNRTRRGVAQAVPLGRDDPRYGLLPKRARLREGVMEGAPLTFGAVRPTVVLPPGLSGEALACVLAHEGVHVSRRDNLWHYATALALVVYWWNPAVWLMARLLRRDIELSCDRAAVKKLGEGSRAGYARALVDLATAAEGPAFCQTFGRKAAEERVISIMKYKKTTILGIVLSLALVVGVTVAFASGPKETPPEGQATTSAPPVATEPAEAVENPAAAPAAPEKDIAEQPAPAEVELPEFVPDYDPEVEDSIPETPVADDHPAQELCVLPTAPTTNCGVEGCTQIMAHQHDGRWYCFMHYVCPVEGCTIAGDHVHDGVVYSCNGFHSGGECDGSCKSETWNQADTTPTAAPVSGGHHSENHSSGHHGDHH